VGDERQIQQVEVALDGAGRDLEAADGKLDSFQQN